MSQVFRRRDLRRPLPAALFAFMFLCFAPNARAACILNLIVIPCLEATVPATYSFGTALAPGTQTISAEQQIVITANMSWGVRIRSDEATGRMREWNGSSYVGGGKVMSSPLQWRLSSIDGSAQSTSFAGLTSTASTVVSDLSSTGCLLGLACDSDPIGVRFRQPVTFSDRRAAPNSYRIQVTYESALGF